MASSLKQLKCWKAFGGFVKQFTHDSASTKTAMRFSVFMPPAAAQPGAKVPVLYYLSGLTCTDENFTQKAGAQRAAAEHGIALVAPDTSPRGHDEIPTENDSYDFGTGAGFYVNATQAPWSTNYNMYDYVVTELPALVRDNFPELDTARQSVFGHSMGGHGALTVALKNPGGYRSASSFSAICNPMNCPWGVKAFTGYLGEDKEAWKAYDASELARAYGAAAGNPTLNLLCDQGLADDFLTGKQLLPEALEAACAGVANINLNSRKHEGYDHSYFFIASFVEDHIKFHAEHLA